MWKCNDKYILERNLDLLTFNARIAQEYKQGTQIR